ncbi:hypothetical protein Hte_006980 [Hypoxylon texense]
MTAFTFGSHSNSVAHGWQAAYFDLERGRINAIHKAKRKQGMYRLIKEVLRSAWAPTHDIARGYYRLKGPGGHEILPAMWSSTVQPGWNVFLILYVYPAHYDHHKHENYAHRASYVPPKPADERDLAMESPMKYPMMCSSVGQPDPSKADLTPTSHYRRADVTGLGWVREREDDVSESSDINFDDQDDEVDIIDFEQEHENALLGVDVLLEKWANDFSDSGNEEQE